MEGLRLAPVKMNEEVDLRQIRNELPDQVSQTHELELARKLNSGEISIQELHRQTISHGISADVGQAMEIALFMSSKREGVDHAISEFKRAVGLDGSHLQGAAQESSEMMNFKLQADQCIAILEDQMKSLSLKLGTNQWQTWVEGESDAEVAIATTVNEIVHTFGQGKDQSLRMLYLKFNSPSASQPSDEPDGLQASWKEALAMVDNEAMTFAQEVGEEVKRVAAEVISKSMGAKAMVGGVSTGSDDLFGNLDDSEEDGGVMAFMLGVVKALAMPFAVMTMEQLGRRCAKNPAAYDEARGTELVQDTPGWGTLNFIPSALCGRSKRATLFVVVYFALGLWFMALFFLFTNDEFATNGGPLFAWQPSQWVEQGQNRLLNNVMLFFAFLCVPFFATLSFRLLIDAARAPICGALIAQLEEHCQTRGPSHAGPKPQLENSGPEGPAWRPVPVPVQRVTSESPSSGAGGQEKGLGQQTVKRLQLASKINSRLGMALTGVGCVAIPAYVVYKDIRHWESGEYAYFVFYAIGLTALGAVAMTSLFAWVNLIAVHCLAMQANLAAYKELLDVLCLTVALQHQAAIAELALDLRRVTAAAVEAANVRTRLHPLVRVLQGRLNARERFLLECSRAMRTDLGRAVSGCYGCTAVFYLFLLAYIALDFIDININGPKTFERFSFALAFLVLIALSILALVQPLLAMAAQAAAWDKVVKACRTPAFAQVSEVLSPVKDGEWLHAHHEWLATELVWEVLGFRVTFATIYSAIASYAGSIWTATVVPAVLLGVNEDLSAR